MGNVMKRNIVPVPKSYDLRRGHRYHYACVLTGQAPKINDATHEI